jgi:Protein of unknown function (DUF2934)
MTKQTSSRSSSSPAKRKPASEAPVPIPQAIAVEARGSVRPPNKPETQLTAAPRRGAPSHEQIAQRAYELYQKRPYGDGNELHDWLRAESDLHAN